MILPQTVVYLAMIFQRNDSLFLLLDNYIFHYIFLINQEFSFSLKKMNNLNISVY